MISLARNSGGDGGFLGLGVSPALSPRAAGGSGSAGEDGSAGRADVGVEGAGPEAPPEGAGMPGITVLEISLAGQGVTGGGALTGTGGDGSAVGLTPEGAEPEAPPEEEDLEGAGPLGMETEALVPGPEGIPVLKTPVQPPMKAASSARADSEIDSRLPPERMTERAARRSTLRLERRLGETSHIRKDTADEVNGDGGINTEGQPEENDGLVFDTERAAGAGEPDSELGTNVEINSSGELALSTGLESELDIDTEVGETSAPRKAAREAWPPTERILTLDVNADGSTDRDDRESSLTKGTDLNETVAMVAVDPGQNGDLELSAEITVGTVDPGEEASLDISSHTSDNATSSAGIETGLTSISRPTAASIQAERGLQGSTQDENRLEGGGTEYTINDISGEDDLIVTLTPGDQEVVKEASGSAWRQPDLQGSTGLGLNDTSLATQGTTLKSGSTLGSETSNERRRVVVVSATEDGAWNGRHVDGDIGNTAEDISGETESTALNGHIGRVSESRARQTGEQNERGTHVKISNVSNV
ncbi:hypothetical protein N7499_004080 [Penicillium canescens]|nr:hypothetical protein N7499_004080 [Penicillium canescens]